MPEQKTIVDAPAHMDPVISALISKLAKEKEPFPLERRLGWLRMMVMALDSAYGVEAPIAVAADHPVAPEEKKWPSQTITQHFGPPTDMVGRGTVVATVKDPARLPRPRAPDEMFLIDLDGKAWGRSAPLAVSTVGPGDVIWDFRPGEQGIESVIWAVPHIGKLPPLTVYKAA